MEVSAENGQTNADAVRFVQVDNANTGTTITHYLGKAYERVQKPYGVIEHKHYMSAGGTTILYTERSNAANDTRYLHKDHLGSTDVITDEQGQVVERLSFDAWGARRNSNWTTAPNYGFDIVSLVTRGFTGHEQDDGVGLINMNARLYDPKLGRFLQPDTFVQHPYITQGMNRYTYVNNNPLSFTDPTGHFLKKLFKRARKMFHKTSVSYQVMHSKPVKEFFLNNQWAQAVGQIAASFFGGPWGAAAWSAYMTEISGGSLSDMLRAAAISYGTAFAFNAVGGEFGHDTWSVEKVFAHGAVGGVSAELQGGSFKDGFISAGLTQAFSAKISKWLPGDRLQPARVVAAAVVGGTASRLAGGKFANGTVTGAFSRLFNDEVLIEDPYNPGKRIRVDSRYATEIEQAKLQGIDLMNPYELNLYRSDSDCVAQCLATDAVFGAIRDKGAALATDQAGRSMSERGYRALGESLRAGAKLIGPVGTVRDLIMFNDTIRKCQAICPSNTP